VQQGKTPYSPFIYPLFALYLTLFAEASIAAGASRYDLLKGWGVIREIKAARASTIPRNKGHPGRKFGLFRKNVCSFCFVI
tara:strand:+ start:382 stop:624 length:243 start_codon:yes stop_codon:yes gene_type:complete